MRVMADLIRSGRPADGDHGREREETGERTRETGAKRSLFLRKRAEVQAMPREAREPVTR